MAGYVANNTFDALLVRLNANGAADNSFGTSGVVVTSDFPTGATANAVAEQPDTKYLVAGSVDGLGKTDFAVVRYDSNGLVDNSFSGDGRLSFSLGNGDEEFVSVTTQNDGKILLAGYSDTGSGEGINYVLSRLLPDGSFDASFDGDGIAEVDFALADDRVTSMALQSDGKIVLAGYSVDAGYDATVARLNPDGSLDTSFGVGGKVRTDVAGLADEFAGVLVQSDGKIVAAGYANDGVSDKLMVARYDQNGALDTSFDGDGSVVLSGLGLLDRASGIVRQDDGKYVLSLVTAIGGDIEMGAVRLTESGALDATFDGDGTLIYSSALGWDFSRGILQQNDGKFVVVGTVSNGADDDLAMLRVNGDGSLDNGFGSLGLASLSFDTTEATPSAIETSEGNLLLVGTQRPEKAIVLSRFESGIVLALDADGDGVPDDQDLCDGTLQLNTDLDGDGCDDATEDWDDDGDGVPDVVDSAPNDDSVSVEVSLPLNAGFKGVELGQEAQR